MENNHGITETPQPKDPAAVRGGPGQRLYQAEPAGPGLERGRQASVRRRTCGTLGLIETRVGEGSFVAHFSVQPIFSELAPLYDNKEGRRDVEQLRNLLEGECTNIAIISSTEEDRQKLKDRLDEYNRLEAIYNDDIENQQKLHDVVQADFAFHYEIICMSHNKLYMDIYMMVQQLISSHIRHLIYTRVHRRKAAWLSLGSVDTMTEASHEAIYQSIINGDAEAARNAREQILGIVPAHGLDYFEDYMDPKDIHP